MGARVCLVDVEAFVLDVRAHLLRPNEQGQACTKYPRWHEQEYAYPSAKPHRWISPHHRS